MKIILPSVSIVLLSLLGFLTFSCEDERAPEYREVGGKLIESYLVLSGVAKDAAFPTPAFKTEMVNVKMHQSRLLLLERISPALKDLRTQLAGKAASLGLAFTAENILEWRLALGMDPDKQKFIGDWAVSFEGIEAAGIMRITGDGRFEHIIGENKAPGLWTSQGGIYECVYFFVNDSEIVPLGSTLMARLSADGKSLEGRFTYHPSGNPEGLTAAWKGLRQ